MGIDILPAPRFGYRPSKDTRNPDGVVRFETLAACCKRESYRSKSLINGHLKYPHLIDAHGRILGFELYLGSCAKEPRETQASCLQMRHQRETIAGNLWPIVEDTSIGEHGVATLLPRGLTFAADKLSNVWPPVLKRRLQSALDRAGVTAAQGYLFAGLHGEFDSIAAEYHLHWHLIVGGDKLAALERLRESATFARNRRFDGTALEPARVRISRLPLTNLPEPLTYSLQSSWPNRPRGTNADTGDRWRGSIRTRIPEPYHAQWLMWMDRWSIGDFVVLNGLRATSEGFELSRRLRV